MSDDEYPEIPGGLHLAPLELYRLQDVVGAQHCFGLVRLGGRALGLGSDGHPDLWDVVYDMTGEPPWEVVHRDELFGEVLEWVAHLADETESARDLADGTVRTVLVNRTDIDVGVVQGDEYVVWKVHFDPQRPPEQLYTCDTVEAAFLDAIIEASFG